MSALTFQYLRDLQQKERLSAELQPIEPGFYKRVAEYVARKAKLTRENNEFSDERELQKMLPVIRDIFNRRETKIAHASIKAARSGDMVTPHLLPEEEALFNSIRQCLKKSRELLEEISTGKGMPSFFDVAPPKTNKKAEVEENSAEPVEVKMMNLKVLEDIPSFVAEDLNVYGPWKKGETVECPEKASEIFISAEKAERIDR